MKQLQFFFALLCLVLPDSLWAIQRYSPGDTLYVWAISGLRMRKTPGLQAEKMRLIPYGTALKVLNEKRGRDGHDITVQAVPEYIDAQSVKSDAVIFTGYFAQVAFQGDTGFVFDSYLSKLLPMQYELTRRIAGEGEKDWQRFEPIENYAQRAFGLLAKKQLGKQPDDHVRLIYANGIVWDMGLEKGLPGRIILPDISMEEAFMLLNNWWQYEQKVRKSAHDPNESIPNFTRKDDHTWYLDDGSCGCGFEITWFAEANLTLITYECGC